MFLWHFNLVFDDAPPLEKLVLRLDHCAPLPFCNPYYDDITQKKPLPLTHATQFLESMASSVGIVEHFDPPDLTLYYTLTRKREPVSGTNQGEPQRKPISPLRHNIQQRRMHHEVYVRDS